MFPVADSKAGSIGTHSTWSPVALGSAKALEHTRRQRRPWTSRDRRTSLDDTPICLNRPGPGDRHFLAGSEIRHLNSKIYVFEKYGQLFLNCGKNFIDENFEFHNISALMLNKFHLKFCSVL